MGGEKGGFVRASATAARPIMPFTDRLKFAFGAVTCLNRNEKELRMELALFFR